MIIIIQVTNKLRASSSKNLYPPSKSQAAPTPSRSTSWHPLWFGFTIPWGQQIWTSRAVLNWISQTLFWHDHLGLGCSQKGSTSKKYCKCNDFQGDTPILSLALVSDIAKSFCFSRKSWRFRTCQKHEIWCGSWKTLKFESNYTCFGNIGLCAPRPRLSEIGTFLIRNTYNYLGNIDTSGSATGIPEFVMFRASSLRAERSRVWSVYTCW